MRFAAVVKKFTFLFRGFPRRYAPLNDMMTTVLTAMTPECLLHAPFSKNKFFSLRCWANPCFSANTLKPYCSVGFFYCIFLIFIFFEHTQTFRKAAILHPRLASGIFHFFLVIPREHSDRWNPAVRRTHQASTHAELRFELLSLSYWEWRGLARLVIARTNAVIGNRHRIFVSI